MKYSVKCEKCGKEFMVELFGKHKDREWKLEHFSWKCEECHKAEKNEKAAEKEKELELPELEGTEKQVAWARQIRIKSLKFFRDWIDLCDDDDEKNAAERKACEKAIAEFQKATSAKWVIDHRDDTVKEWM